MSQFRYLLRTMRLGPAILGIFLIGNLLLHSNCSSSGQVLEDWIEAEKKTDDESLNSPRHQKLMQLLSEKGYQGVGLQYESSETLDLFTEVFSNPAVAGRRIKLVYTGLQMSYDKKHSSLTIGGTKSSPQIIQYIRKTIPKRKK